MKYVISIASFLFLAACGSEAPERVVNKRGNSTDLMKQQTTLAKAMTDLPTCNKASLNKIVFVHEVSAFKVCRNESWMDVDSTKASELGNTVVELRQMAGEELNLCGDDPKAGVSCFLEGGEFIRYASGKVKYTVRVARKKATPVANTYTSMETLDASKASVVHEAMWPTSEVLLVPSVTRGGIQSGVWLRYNADTKAFTLFFDKNQDGTFSDGDEILGEPNLKDF